MSIVNVFDRVDDTLVRSFENAYSSLTNEKTFHVRIKSYGGNYGSFGAISPIIFDIAQKRVLVVGEGLHVESAAMLLFLNCSERIVDDSSKGIIHLPEPNTFVSEELYEKTKKEAVLFIKRRTHLSEDTIVSLNAIELTPSEMHRWHIATKKIERFNWAEQ